MDESKSIPKLLSVTEVSKTLKLSEQRVRGLASTGQLRSTKVGSTWVIDSDSVNDLAEQKGLIVRPKSKVNSSSKNSSLKVISFFSGAMGLDLGLEKAGLETILACEYDKWSRETIKQNKPDLPLLGDVWNCTPALVREAAGLGPQDEIDVIAGGPPCQAFSTAGARKGFEDVRGNVFLHFIDLALELNPKYLVLENVRGLLSAALKHRPLNQRGPGSDPLSDEELPGGALKFILAKIQKHGYSVSFNLYNAANFGAPQTRERIIIICSRNGSKVPYLNPTNSDSEQFGLPNWKTFRDACGDLPLSDSKGVQFPPERLKYFKLLGPGQYWKHLPEKMQLEAMGNSYYSGGGKTGFYRRLDWDKPSPTLVTHPAMPATDLGHPTEDRPLSVEEYKRIQVFPDDWDIMGPVVQQYKQIGNAVPVPLGFAVGLALKAHANGKTVKLPKGFKYSRYRGTTELDFLQD